jgi:uncharacterized membrane protein
MFSRLFCLPNNVEAQMHKKTMKFAKSALLIAIAAVIAFIVLMPKNDNSEDAVKAREARREAYQSEMRAKDAERQAYDKEHHIGEIADATMAFNNFKKRLRNPDSLKVIKAYRMHDGSFCITYRAQNGFGGMTGGMAVYTNHTIIDETDNIFSQAWEKLCSAGVAEEDVGYQLQ